VINTLHPLIGLLIGVAAAMPSPQLPPAPPPRTATLPDKPAPIEKLGPTTFRVGKMRVDTARRELVVPGTINQASTLEFVANTTDGAKAYESAITLETNAISFNAALLLLGLDPSRSRPSRMQFDTTPPEGDPVDIEVEWRDGGRTRRVKIEELLFDQRAKKTVAPGPWVYAASTFIEVGGGQRAYLAELDGVLIGLMHGPQAVIDNPRNDTVGGYGSIILNPRLGLKEHTPVSVTIKALPLEQKQRR
jgi:hypothetical protein